jgi:ribosomal protein S15P/S13E
MGRNGSLPSITAQDAQVRRELLELAERFRRLATYLERRYLNQ